MRLRHTCCAYAASYLACWPTLQRVCPALRDVDFAPSKLRYDRRSARRVRVHARRRDDDEDATILV